MKLTEMDRPQLSRYARKLGLRPLKKQTDAELLKEIRAERKRRTTWPAEWTAPNRRVYFQEIVGKSMPKDSAAAYRELVKAIDAKVPQIEARLTETGPDCLGLFYEPGFFGCNEACPVMPLCKAACERRPELAEQARALDGAASEVDALSDTDVKEALSTTAVRDTWYQWLLEEWDASIFEGVALEEIKVLRWMFKTGRFTLIQATARFAKYYDDAEATTPEDLQRLIDGGCLALAEPPAPEKPPAKKARKKATKRSTTATKRAPKTARKA